MLTRGVADGHPYTLTVSSKGGPLCMGVNDHLSRRQQRSGNNFYEWGCGFGPDDNGQSSAIDEANAGQTYLYWGPAPVGAVKARLDTFTMKPNRHPGGHALIDPTGCRASEPDHLWVRITHRLPGWTASGGWFITHVHVGARDCGYGDAVFFDQHGNRITEPHW